MAGIYLHIPFCKQACNYCDFHFSTSLEKKVALVAALRRELELRVAEIDEPVETIYFGGGTPSLLSINEINSLLECIFRLYHVVSSPEITLEANPDDLNQEYLIALRSTPINRLSIGVQSFYDDDLQLMNRAHNAQEALASLRWATHYFDNISIDLIYGIPHMSLEKWSANIDIALRLQVAHISSYALTVEPKTALAYAITKGKIDAPDEALAHQHYDLLVKRLVAAGYEHYELSNFAQPQMYSRNNSAYWLGKKYMGIGPSAHSFNGTQRSWNKSNNSLYMRSIAQGVVPQEIEILTKANQYNEYIMTGLRTIWGISLTKIASEFGEKGLKYLLENAASFLESGQLKIENNVLTTTLEGAFFSDGIAAALFYVEDSTEY